jgi:hypothetical protein
VPVLWARTFGPALCLGVGAAMLIAGFVMIGLRVRSSRVEQDFPDEWASFDDLKEAFD